MLGTVQYATLIPGPTRFRTSGRVQRAPAPRRNRLKLVLLHQIHRYGFKHGSFPPDICFGIYARMVYESVNTVVGANAMWPGVLGTSLQHQWMKTGLSGRPGPAGHSSIILTCHNMDYAKSTWIWGKFTKKTQSLELCFRVILGGWECSHSIRWYSFFFSNFSKTYFFGRSKDGDLIFSAKSQIVKWFL